MSQTQTLILAIGGFQGLLLFVLLVSDKRVNYASKLLGLQCLFLATTFALPIIVVSENTSFTWLIGSLLFLPACYGALTYLYCRVAITGAPLKPGDAIHGLPIVVCCLLNLDVVLSAEEALSFVKQPDLTFFRHQLTATIFYGQAVLYVVLLIRMVSRYKRMAKQTLSSYNPEIFKWLTSLIVFMISIWALKAAFYYLERSQELNMLADGLLVMMVYFIAIVQWRNPGLFHIHKLEAQLSDDTAPRNRHRSDGQLDTETRSSVLTFVQAQVEQEALYRDSELTLTTLAERVGVSVHHLSETLNQLGGKNFNLFINEYRVAEVCKQLEEESERTLIDIALDSGFSSKSSFNATFKKLTGKTPSVYRRQVGSA